MIPLDTPPGTDVICVDDDPGAWRGVPLIVKGSVYTVSGWGECVTTKQQLVRLEQTPEPFTFIGFQPDRFRLLDIPLELTRLLEAQTLVTDPVVLDFIKRVYGDAVEVTEQTR